VEPLLYDAIVKEIGNGEQAHTLMMSHPAAYQFVATTPRMFSGRSEVRSFVKSIGSQPPVVTHSMQILQSIRRAHLQRQDG
jgi:hypothetical protein